ncbi:hypothetical protein FXO38_08671 [Capsicum annuum]|nr:hypothetical protein FXO38_08671 [Capsicum annuum]
MLLLEVKCNKKNSMAFYVKRSYIEFILDVFGIVIGLSTKISNSVLSSIREKGGGSRLLNTYFDGADKLKMGDLKNFMETSKDLCREYGWGELSFDETICSLKCSLKPTKITVRSSYQLVGFPYAFMKLQRTCSKKFKKILDKNKPLKSELSKIKTLLLGKLKVDGDILPDKQSDNLQGESSHDPMVDDQYDDSTKKRSFSQGHTNRVVLDSDASLLLLFHGHDKLFFDIRTSSFEEKTRQAEEGKSTKGHSNKKEEAAEETATGLGPLNMEEIRQAKNQDFGGTKVDEDNIDETKNCGDVDSIINNVISSVFAASSSLPTSPDELGGINNDTTDVISDVDATTNAKNIYTKGKDVFPERLMFGSCDVDSKEWFYSLATCGRPLNDMHLDTIFYYMRNKAKYEPNIVVKFTTTDFVFRNKINALYHDFVKNGKDFSPIPEKHEVEEYIRGFYCDANILWNKVDYVLFSVYVPWEKSELGH